MPSMENEAKGKLIRDICRELCLCQANGMHYFYEIFELFGTVILKITVKV